jgi:hypothetical protein
LLVSHKSSDGRHGYQAKYKLTEDPELIAKATWTPEAWEELVNLRYRRQAFLAGRMFRKASSDFRKVEREFGSSDETLSTEMNDWTWNLKVYGKSAATL